MLRIASKTSCVKRLGDSAWATSKKRAALRFTHISTQYDEVFTNEVRKSYMSHMKHL